jgi:hypothetical protein
VETGHRHVTAVAEIGHRLEGEHVAVGRPVGRVAGDTTLHPERTVLVNVGAVLVDVALCAGSCADRDRRCTE